VQPNNEKPRTACRQGRGFDSITIKESEIKMNATTSLVKNQAAQLVHLVDGKPTTTSNVIASTFGKLHKAVLRAIKNLGCSSEFYERNFAPIQIEVDLGMGRSRKDPAFEVTRDGFSFLAMGFTGKEAAKWKEAYINAFNLMESEIHRIQYSVNPSDVLTASQAEQLRITLKDHCDKLPKAQQAGFMIKGWSKLKSHFGVTYRNIPQSELSEALSLIARHTSEWDLLEVTKPMQIAQLQFSRQLTVVLEDGTHIIDARGKNLIDAEHVRSIQRDCKILQDAMREISHRMRICFGDIDADALDHPLNARFAVPA
jgi:Rha family phage regulatory protein